MGAAAPGWEAEVKGRQRAAAARREDGRSIFADDGDEEDLAMIVDVRYGEEQRGAWPYASERGM